jgi:hypothetical protein
LVISNSNISLFAKTFIGIGMCLFCAACGTIAKPVYADSVNLIEIQVSQLPSTAPFSVEVSGSRLGTGLCVVTYQSDYWEKGDLTETQQPHQMTLQIDDQKPLSLNGQYIFWNNANIETVYDDNHQPTGSYLTAPMHICFGSFIRNLDLGTHKGVMEISATSGAIHRYEWTFNIAKLVQTSLSPNIKPTVIYLENNPEPTPVFVRRLSSVASDIYSLWCRGFPLNEGIHIEFDKSGFDSSQFSVDNLNVMIDSNPVTKTGMCIYDTDSNSWVVTLDTSRLAAGLHMASMTIKNNSGQNYSINWTFRVELPLRK